MPNFPFVPNRWPEQAQQEYDLWQEIIGVWRPIEEQVWELIRLEPPGSRALGDPGTWGPNEWALLDEAARQLEEELIGRSRNPAHYADPAHAEDAILAKAGRTGFATGMDRAVLLTKAGESHLLPMRGEQAIQEFLSIGFNRLSDQGRLRLAGILRDPDYPGGSVQSILRQAMAEGENPIATARALSKRFDEYERWEFARLARTEVAFAQNTGMEAEWEAEGFSRPPDIQAGALFSSPPWHPNCICSIVPDPATGYIVYDVATTACSICQGMLARQRSFFAGHEVEPREPVE